MSAVNVPSSSFAAIDLIESRMPLLIQLAIPELISISITDGQKIIGQVAGANDAGVKLVWLCEYNRANSESKDILLELSYGAYTSQVYSVVPVDDTGLALDVIRKRKLAGGRKNSMLAAMPLRDIAVVAKALDGFIEDALASYFVDTANYAIYG